MNRDEGRPPPPITILHVITRLVRGGAQLVVRDLLRHADHGEFRVVVAAGPETGSEGSLWEEIESFGIETHRVPSLQREIQPRLDLRALGELRTLIREIQPNVVHAHTSKAGLLGCRAARSERVPAIVFAPHGHIAASGAKIPGVPDRGWKRWLLRTLARYNSKLAHVVVAPNESERRDGIQHGMWSDGGSITIPNGIDTERFQPRNAADARTLAGWPKADAESDAPRLMGCVARLTEEKGVDLAVCALRDLPDVTLVVIGDGPERPRLEQLAAEIGVADRVIFHGITEDVSALYSAFDLVVVPSRTEAHGLVAAEALACGVPVVTSGVGGLRSIVVPGKTGLHFGKDDPAALAAVARQLLDNPDRANTLAEAGRAHVAHSFSLRTMISRTERLYRELLTDSPAAVPSRTAAPAS
ncbi:MAG: glycosyltransferase family 4 protein [Planctomycetota bacterium]